MNYIYTHNLQPMIFNLKLGGFSLAPRWYAMMYLLGFVAAYFVIKKFSQEKKLPLTSDDLMDFLTYIMLGVILGGRLGYVLFYNLKLYIENPFEILAIWHGGMSFHGGALGVIVAIILYARKKKIPFWTFADICCVATPPGLMFGRIGNFINGELWGRPTDGTWGVIFPNGGGDMPRHPTQLYEATLEGLLLFIVLYALMRFAKLKPGSIAGLFLAGYGMGRSVVEFYRLPDKHMNPLHDGYLFVETVGGEWVTMGMLLCLPMILVGGAMFLWSNLRKWPELAMANIPVNQTTPAPAPETNPDEVSPFSSSEPIPEVPDNEQPGQYPGQFYQDDQYAQQGQYDQQGQYYDQGQYQDGQYNQQGQYQDGQYYDQGQYQDGQYNQQGQYQDGQYYDQGQYDQQGQYYDQGQYQDGQYNQQGQYQDGQYNQDPNQYPPQQ